MFSISSLGFVISVIVFHGVPVVSLSSNITIKLNKTITSSHQLYGDFIYLNSSSKIQINFSDVNETLSFIIFQVHSHLYDILLYKNANTKETQVTGTNVGLYSKANPLKDTYYIENSNSKVGLKLYVAVHGYGNIDLVPGGCNMEFPQKISPYIKTSNSKDYIYVDAAPAAVLNDPKCLNVKSVDYIFRMIYLPEKNFNPETYFAGIINIMDMNSIQLNTRIIPMTNNWKTRREVSAYPGTGAVYIVIARVEQRYSMYVPAVSYACSPLLQGSCGDIDDVLLQYLCVAVFFIGIFVCYFGNRFFKTEMFLIGFISGLIIAYILIAQTILLDKSALILASTLSGVFFGAVWLMFWWLYGIPVVAVLLPSLDVGFLFACLIYYVIPNSSVYLQNDLNFWCVFMLIMLLIALALISLTHIANILCCAVLGSYAAVFSIDFYVGSNLKYILLNTLRRAIVPKFNRAVLMPPFQVSDLIMTVVWIALAVTGSLFQFYQNKGRPPFPPPPRRAILPDAVTYGTYTRLGSRRLQEEPTRTVTNQNERTPLLG